jgi:tRNA pseudouridine55 synthase
VDGLVLVDKPAGKTSHDLTLAVRRGLQIRKAGHAGTLDPFATGLLLVLVGRARRAQRFLMALPKTYVAVARFGAVSTTGDPEGEITVTGVVPEGELELPTGRVRQRPPAYSAVRVQGMRAYERARRGETVDVPEREVTVHRFEQLWREDDRAGFLIECSSGTYVRSLIADLGDAYCEELRRTAVGPFDVADADPGRVLGLEQSLSFLPRIELDADRAWRIAHGQTVEAPESDPSAEHVLLADAEGVIAIAEPREDARLKPIVGFRG